MHRPASWIAILLALTMSPVRGDTLDSIRQRGKLVWGADAEGGGPYVYADPGNLDQMIGFEAELANLLARELAVQSEFAQGAWDTLPALLKTGEIDVVKWL